MKTMMLAAMLTLALSACSYRAKNVSYQGKLSRATRHMLSVDFVDLIVEPDDENQEDYVVLTKEEAELRNHQNPSKVKRKKKSKITYFVTKNDDGEWVYVPEGNL